MATEIVTQPAAEAVLASVPFDRRTSLGLLLPHFKNNGWLDLERIAASFLLIDALLSDSLNEEELDAKFAASAARLIGAAPEMLNAFDELAAAIGNDPNFAATIMTALGQKANTSALAAYALLTGATFTGDVIVPNQAQGTNNTKSANTAFVIAEILARVVKATGTDIRGLADDAKFVTAKAMADAMAFQAVALAAGSNALALASGFNKTLTCPAAAFSIAAPTGMFPGMTGCLVFTQPASGAVSPSWNAFWDFGAAGPPTLNTAASAVDYVYYTVLSGTKAHCAYARGAV